MDGTTVSSDAGEQEHHKVSHTHTHDVRDGNELLIMLLLDVYDQSGSETPSRAVLMCVIHRH